MKKLITSIVFVLFACNSAFAQTGTGTQVDPWYIGDVSAEDISAYINGNTLYIRGQGRMKDFSFSATKWNLQLSIITTVIISGEIKNIGNYSFAGCNNLTSVTFPGNLESIGNYAFQFATNLPRINLPNSLTSIGTSAFRGCSTLSAIYIPNGVQSIESYAFFDCTALTTVTGADVKTIRAHAFDGCTSLKNYPFDKVDLKTIDEYAFQQTALTEVRLGINVESLGQHAFDGCSALTSITIQPNLTTINDYAFANCPLLTVVRNSNLTPQTITYNNQFYNASPPRDNTFTDTLIVGVRALNLYTGDTEWSNFYKIQAECKVSFDTLRGTSVGVAWVISNNLIPRPPPPTRYRYTFDGWCTDTFYTQRWDFATYRVSSDTTLYAKWDSIPITAFDIDSTAIHLTMRYDRTRQLTLTVEPENATDQSKNWWSDDPLIATVDGDGLVTAVSEGTTTIYVGPSSNPLLTKDCSVTVSKAGQILTWNQPLDYTYGDPAITLTATVNSGIPVTYTSDDTLVATINNTILTIKNAGSANISANCASSADYYPATETQSLTIAQAPLTVRAKDVVWIHGETYKPEPEEIIYEGWQYSDDATNNDFSTPPLIDFDPTIDRPVGTYPIRVILGRSNNYEFVTPDGWLYVIHNPEEDNIVEIPNSTPPNAIHSNYIADCGITESVVKLMPKNPTTKVYFVDKNGNLTASDSLIVDIRRPGTYPVTYILKSLVDSVPYTLEIESLVQWDSIIGMRYNNVLIVKTINSYGFTFSNCEWFEDDTPLTSGLYYSAGANHHTDRLKETATYRATLYTDDGDTLHTCAGQITLYKEEPVNAPLQIYPNPAPKGQSVTIEGIPEDAKEIKIYDLNGRVVGTWQAATPQMPSSATIPMPAGNGIYLLKAGGKSVKVTVE
ncbi:hypothetical protein AGMMS49982_12520 [Bacteroidia bacterium]|nr:hypothetical protein AGMMS49982_12520 [Bacteroidia bacterium]